MSNQFRPARLLCLVAVIAPALSLAACGPDRDALISEKVARAEAAARRAEKARDAAEKAAKALQATAPTTVETTPEPSEDAPEEVTEAEG